MAEAIIPDGYIESVINEYSRTESGKKKGLPKNPFKSSTTAPKDMNNYAIEMKEILYEHIHDVIDSVIEADIEVGSPYKDSAGAWCIDIEFKPGVMRRESLIPKAYPEGVENIVLHFSHGWDADNYVYGSWHGDRVRSRKHKNPDPFLKEAVDEFNAKYGDVARAELTAEYK